MKSNNVRAIAQNPPVPIGTPGVADARWLPDAGFDAGWDAIVMPGDTKSRLARQGAATMMLRREVAADALPLHGIINPGWKLHVPAGGDADLINGLVDGVHVVVGSPAPAAPPAAAATSRVGGFDLTALE